jgi:hypothetical protein
MKFLLSIIALIAVTFSAAAQNWSSGSLSAGVNLISSSAYSLATLQLVDTSGSANVITLYDNDSASSTNRVTASYTGRLSYTTNEVRSFTDFQGVSRTVTNATLKVVDVVVAAATNEARRVWRYTLPANGTVTFTPGNPQGSSYGLQVLASGTATYNLYGRTLP